MARGPFSRMRAEQCLSLRQQLVSGNNPVHQPDAIRLGGIDHSAGQQQLQGSTPSHQAGEPRSAAVSRADAELHFRLPELGLLRGDADMAGHGQLAAATESEAVDCGDDRFAAAFQAAKHLLAQQGAGLPLDRSLLRPAR